MNAELVQMNCPCCFAEVIDVYDRVECSRCRWMTSKQSLHAFAQLTQAYQLACAERDEAKAACDAGLRVFEGHDAGRPIAVQMLRNATRRDR